MIALSCIFLVLSCVVLMLSLGVGPFARAPWEDYHFTFKKRSGWAQSAIKLAASIIATVMTIIIITGVS